MGAGLFGAFAASKELRFQGFSAGAALLMGNGACPCSIAWGMVRVLVCACSRMDVLFPDGS